MFIIHHTKTALYDTAVSVQKHFSGGKCMLVTIWQPIGTVASNAAAVLIVRRPSREYLILTCGPID